MERRAFSTRIFFACKPGNELPGYTTPPVPGEYQDHEAVMMDDAPRPIRTPENLGSGLITSSMGFWNLGSGSITTSMCFWNLGSGSITTSTRF